MARLHTGNYWRARHYSSPNSDPTPKTSPPPPPFTQPFVGRYTTQTFGYCEACGLWVGFADDRSIDHFKPGLVPCHGLSISAEPPWNPDWVYGPAPQAR